MDVKLRGGAEADAASCGEIAFAAFRAIAEKHNFPPDFPTPAAATDLVKNLFSREDVYSIVAESGGQVVGSNFLWEHPPVAAVGPITVNPETQDASVGRRLMEDVLRRAREKKFSSVRLVQAAYHGRSLSLYAKLGFVSREPLAVMQGRAIDRCNGDYAVRLACDEDLQACNSICINVHGLDRSLELADAIRAGTATVVMRGKQITGYATMIGFFGHAVARDNESMHSLIAGASEFAGPGLLVPIRNGELFRWCLDNGLRVVQPMTLMSAGLYNEPHGAFLPSVLY